MHNPDPTPHPLPADLASERLIRPAQLAAMLSCNVSHLYRLARAGKLPPPRRISHRISGWRASEVLPWIRGEAA